MALKLANAESGGGKKGKLGGPNRQVNTFPSNILYMSGFSGMGTLNLRKEKKTSSWQKSNILQRDDPINRLSTSYTFLAMIIQDMQKTCSLRPIFMK